MGALESLLAIGGAESVGMALPMLRHTDAELVQGALECVAAHGDPEILRELFPLLANDHWSVRARVAQVLSERGLERGVPAILRRLEVERDDFVRESMLDALRRLER